jgi:hypothetical protein
VRGLEGPALLVIGEVAALADVTAPHAIEDLVAISRQGGAAS